MTPTWISWMAMRNRCARATWHAFKHYGGRGITVCARWQKFENFYVDMGERPPGMSLDRINPNGNYTPRNCRWADAKTQAHNRRKAKERK